jgi:hypothetical protein
MSLLKKAVAPLWMNGATNNVLGIERKKGSGAGFT